MHTLQSSRLAWHNQNLLYFFIDIGWAIAMASCVYQINPDVTTANTLLVWFITLSFFWHATTMPIRFFNQSYRHPVRLVASVVVVALAYFFVLRASYSIISLFLVSIFWVFGVSVMRVLISRVKPAQRLLGHPFVLTSLKNNYKFKKIECVSPINVNLNELDCVVFDPEFNYSRDWQDFFMHISTVGIPVFSISELQELIYGKVPVELLKESWIAQSFVFNRFYLKLKRFIDLSVSLLVLPLLLVVSIFIAFFIKVSMGGPVLFKQKRVGLGGKIFTIYKFRTMKSVTKVAGETIEETKGKHDPRITQLGKILRGFRLDELPQFFNIIKGDMSLVGPRPEWQQTATEFAKEIPLYQLRHVVRPGVTGWAQIQQGHITGVEGNYHKLRYDLYYIKHCSIWLDLKIILKTIEILLSKKGI